MADLVVAETTCDGKKKMFELLAETQPMYVLELPQKAERPRCARALGARAAQVSTASGDGCSTWTITDEQDPPGHPDDEPRARPAPAVGRPDEGRPPPLTGRQLLEFKSIISGIEADLQQYERALELYGSQGVASQPSLRRATKCAHSTASRSACC